jgi:prepilin-type N-terminal cleavage/methylation domain-containing protein
MIILQKNENKVMKNIKSIHLKGFTLIESLLSLVIIGVVISLTLLNIKTNTTDNEDRKVNLVSYADSYKFKAMNLEVYKFANELANSAMKNNPSDFSKLCNTGDFDNDSLCAKNLFLPYLSYLKLCNTTADTRANCFISAKQLNGTDTLMDGSGAILSNGYALTFSIQYSSNNNGFVILSIDTNGSGSEPNTIGYDVLQLNIDYSGNVKPYLQNSAVTETCINEPDTGWDTLLNTGRACITDYLSGKK